MQIAIDDNAELILKEGGGIERVSDGRFVVQQAKSKINTILGEWLPDPTIGFINADDFEKHYNVFEFEDRIRSILLSIDGLNEIIYINVEVVNRIMFISFEANTTYGTISTSVRWEPIV